MMPPGGVKPPLKRGCEMGLQVDSSAPKGPEATAQGNALTFWIGTRV